MKTRGTPGFHRGEVIPSSNKQRNPKMAGLSRFCPGLPGGWPWWPPADVRHPALPRPGVEGD